MGDTGLEPSPETSGKDGAKRQRGAECGALSPDSADASGTADPDLARLAAAWADLPPAIRAGIMAMVDASKGGAR